MTTIQANGINLDYDEMGNPHDPALVLIRGLETQRIQWPEAFLNGLVQHGLRVICFDNRDAGLSRKFSECGTPDVAAALAAIRAGKPFPSPYTLADMACDVIGLLDALQIRQAHVAGISMGGMIAQHLAATHGKRLLSMISIMSTSGAPGLPPTKPEAMPALMPQTGNPGDRNAVIEHSVKMQQLTGSPGYPTDQETLRSTAARAYDRSYNPDGTARQLVATLADTERYKLLTKIRVPTLVIHGEDDLMIPIEGGLDTAERISHAVFHAIPGMGHDIPPGLVPRLVELIAGHIKQAI